MVALVFAPVSLDVVWLVLGVMVALALAPPSRHDASLGSQEAQKRQAAEDAEHPAARGSRPHDSREPVEGRSIHTTALLTRISPVVHVSSTKARLRLA
jgi:hypothetical protein